MLQATQLGRRIGETWIWRGVDLHLAPRESVAVVGPTGAGKSLLLRCLAGLDAAEEGRIELNGRSLQQWQVPSYRAHAVFVHQRPALWDGSVEDNLRAVFRLAVHASRQYDRVAAIERLAAFERGAEFLDRPTADLSGGEAQIVALIRALSIEPSVMLLDEPSASMDAVATRQAEDMVLAWIRGGAERACVWTSHDAEQVDRVAGRTLQLGTGAAPAAAAS